MSETNELKASSKCPICGVDTPHYHSPEQAEAYRSDQMRDDGWTSTAHKVPTKRGWYLCLGVEIDTDQAQPHLRHQISWFLWVRDGAARDFASKIPEALYFDQMEGGWRLRNLLGNAHESGRENRHPVFAKVQYWREIPPIKDTP